MHGVPQESVLDPLLWNSGYDWGLRSALHLSDVSVFCYADDTIVMAGGAIHRDTVFRITASVALVVGQIRQLGLERLARGGVSIGIKSKLGYLGLVLYSRLSFVQHFRQLSPRLIGASVALA